MGSMHKRNKNIAKKTKKKRLSPKSKSHLVLRYATEPKIIVPTLFIVGVAIAACLFFLLTAGHNPQQQSEAIGAADQPPAKAASNVDPTYYNNLDLSKARQASYSNSQITNVKSFGVVNDVREELVSFKVPKDGLSEYALMTLPQAAKNKYPVLILCHGYASPQAYSTLENYVEDMDYYSQHGFAVIKPDFRGNGFTIASGTPDGAFYSMSYNTDVMSLIAAIKQTKYLDASNISIWGHSMGAYVALRAAVVSPDIKHVILLSGPVGTAKDMYLDYEPISDYNNSAALDIRTEQLNEHGTPASNPAFWAKASPLNYLRGMKADVQIHVGSADTIVPPKFSADLNQELTQKKVPHEYYIYPGATHGLVAQRGLIWQRSLNFLTDKSTAGTKQRHS